MTRAARGYSPRAGGRSEASLAGAFCPAIGIGAQLLGSFGAGAAVSPRTWHLYATNRTFSRYSKGSLYSWPHKSFVRDGDDGRVEMRKLFWIATGLLERFSTALSRHGIPVG